MPRKINPEAATTGRLSSSKPNLAGKFNQVESPRRVEKPKIPLTIQEVKNRIPKDCQMHLMHTDGVGWTVIFVDRIIGCVRGINEDAEHDLVNAVTLALENANAKN